MAHNLDTAEMLIDGTPFIRTVSPDGALDESAAQELAEAMAATPAPSKRLLLKELFARYDAAYAEFEPVKSVTVTIDGGLEKTFGRDMKEIQS